MNNAVGFRSVLMIVITIAGASAAAVGQDWPQIPGPGRNGIYPGTPIVPSFPRTDPPLLWQRDIGAGFAGPAVSAGKLVLFHRVNNRPSTSLGGDREPVERSRDRRGDGRGDGEDDLGVRLSHPRST